MPTYLAIQQSGFWKEKQWDLDIHQDKSERPIDIIYLRRLHRISKNHCFVHESKNIGNIKILS